MSGERGPGAPFEDVVDGMRREGLLEPPPTVGSGEEAHEGTGRVQLSFTPANRTVRVPPGVSVFDAASWNGIAIDSTCGGHGTCRKCLVRVTSGSAPVTRHDRRTFSDEQVGDGWRLACLVKATHDLGLEVPPLVTRPKASTVGVGRQVILRPAVQKRYVELTEPTLADQRTDLRRLRDAIEDLTIEPDLHALRRLPKVLRDSDFKVTAVVVDETLIDVEPGDTTGRRHAIAYDLGTTTVVATLLDLETGTPVAVSSILNKQQPFGGDVITRISATMMDPEALGRLTSLAQQTLAELADEVLTEGGIAPEEVYEVALAGNATMTALLLGIDPEPLGVAPFIQVSADWPMLMATDLGLTVHPGARAVLFPALGAYVGGDIVAGMLASGLDRDKRVRLFIDVGTNCEIALSDGERIVTTAAPAGPAFEGGAIRCGMRAADGAIEVIKLDPAAQDADAAVTLGVIGDVEPRGLCGSGLVDAVAELWRVGLLDASGRFVPEEDAARDLPLLAPRLTTVGAGERVFVLHRPTPDAPTTESVYLSQRDVRELQFAKAAISTGWTLLLEELGVEPRDVQQVLLAGSFGSYLSPASAVRIGLVPKLPVLRIVSAGNVAGEGAKMVLLSARERAGADALLEEVRYVELSDRPDFNDRFVDQLAFPV
ncbi:ASKHA domain-containing protein [Oryzobacter terrae]|uniref:ASKHA domain-containing protein n=1 Tax=Oryzobacter terrae TaxID=1620385 RepID=UPI003672A95E